MPMSLGNTFCMMRVGQEVAGWKRGKLQDWDGECANVLQHFVMESDNSAGVMMNVCERKVLPMYEGVEGSQ